ncbi:MAG: hypothetical protein GWN16_10190, partial [Calditrichae bacterium]|nr:hypothetical protein [Calditrichia bacterium]
MVYYSRHQLEYILDKMVSQLKQYHKSFPNRPGMNERELSSKLEKLFPPESLQIAIDLGLAQNQ